MIVTRDICDLGRPDRLRLRVGVWLVRLGRRVLAPFGETIIAQRGEDCT